VYGASVAAPEWVLLAYRLPREPSTPRITLWRKLRRLGAVQLVDGLVALPADPKAIEAFDWLADEVVEANGEAWTWRGRAGSKAQEHALRERMAAAIADEYRALLAEAKAARSEPTRRTVERLRRELHNVESRDHVAPKEREQARRAITRLVDAIDTAEAREIVR
jgi:Protein ChrB, N-terminal